MNLFENLGRRLDMARSSFVGRVWQPLLGGAGELWRHRPWFRHGLTVVLLVGGVMATWLAVMAAQSWLYYRDIGRQPYRTSHFRIAAKKAVSTLIEPFYDRGLEDLGALPAYEVVMSEKRHAEWQRMLERVYARGYAEESDQVWMPARFWHRGEVTEVDVRGRGTLFTHYKVGKPSMRIKFPRDEFFRGQRVINLIIPYDQARVVGDTTISAVARHYDLITYPTRFVTLRVNGDQMGVYHEVPHFRKELAVLQFRSEGYFMSSLGEPKGVPGRAWAEMQESNTGFVRALRAFSACVKQPCPAAEARRVLDHYVDFDRMAAYAAITTLFGASHGWGEDNLMLFFDPPRGRLEPVPWDMGTLRLGKGQDPFVGLESVKGIGAAFLEFDDFRLARDRYAWDVIQRQRQFALDESERLYSDIRPALALDTEHSRRYTQRMVDYFQGALKHNFGLWREHLETQDLVASLDASGRVIVRNHGAAAVRVESIEVETLAGTTKLIPGQALIVPGRYRDEPGEAGVDPRSVDAETRVSNRTAERLGEEARGVVLRGRNAVTGAAIDPEKVRFDRVAPPVHGVFGSRMPPEGVRLEGTEEAPIWVFEGPVYLPSTVAVPEEVEVRFEPGAQVHLADGAELRLPGSPAPPEGVRFEGEPGDRVWVFGGKLRIRHSLVLPEGQRVRFEPGLHLTLDPEVSLVIRGDVESLGTEEEPIWIGAERVRHPFAFIAILGRAHRPVVVRLRHTTIQGGSEGKFDAATFTGMFSIYDGHLTMEKSRILDARGEDGLNVKFGYAELYDNEFVRIASDAVDLDFCRGVVRGNYFSQVKADGLDLSGSLVKAEGNILEGLRDKGFSIGEATTVSLIDNTVRNAVTGVAVKDVSRALLQPGPMEELRIGLAVYQKKQIFGSGLLAVAGPPPEDAETPHLVDPGGLIYRLEEDPEPASPMAAAAGAGDGRSR